MSVPLEEKFGDWLNQLKQEEEKQQQLEQQQQQPPQPPPQQQQQLPTQQQPPTLEQVKHKHYEVVEYLRSVRDMLICLDLDYDDGEESDDLFTDGTNGSDDTQPQSEPRVKSIYDDMF